MKEKKEPEQILKKKITVGFTEKEFEKLDKIRDKTVISSRSSFLRYLIGRALRREILEDIQKPRGLDEH